MIIRNSSLVMAPPKKPLNKVPDLRFDDGNVIIKLGKSSQDWLLLHKEVVQARLPLLAPVFSTDWGRKQLVEHPKTGEQLEVYYFGLKYVDKTWLLKGKCTYR